jgi:hypothetical protein
MKLRCLSFTHVRRSNDDSVVGKRKALAKRPEEPATTTRIQLSAEAMLKCWDIAQESFTVVPASRLKQQYDMRSPLLPNKSSKRRPVNIFFPLCPDHLITLLQFNALRAMATNRSLISGILFGPLACDEETIHIVPYPKEPHLLPPTLLPTLLQQKEPHGDWIDTFPCPEGRDRLIRAAGTFDEDKLWADCIGGLYEGFPDDEVERRGIIAWSPPWDITGWEMSEGFFKKWGWIFRGVPGALEATNQWRLRRGEEPLVYEDIDSQACTFES